jgi:ferredoxin--NADP+ reductase
MHLRDFDTGERYHARVLANAAITGAGAAEEVRELVLEVERPEFTCAAGQSVGLIVPGPFRQAGPADLALRHEHHFRLYSVADTQRPGRNGRPEITLCVRRCFYVDEYSGERYPGIASNYLCDRRVDDVVTLNGPFGLPFAVPENRDADLLLVGMGTGIAPFRAFVKHLYRDVGDWRGRVRLFYGARSGLELLYMNDEQDDFAQYYDRETFAAFKALSPRPHFGDPVALDEALQQRAEEVLSIITGARGHIYVAGQQEILHTLEKALARILGAQADWQQLKSRLQASGRWRELLY